MKISCFAIKPKQKCAALEVRRCPGYKHCPFYKNCTQYDADIQLAYLRLRLLPPEAQRAIADQYYHGEMPWVIVRSEEYPSEKALIF